MFKAFKQGVYGLLFRAFVLVVLMSFTLVGVMPPQQAFALGVDLPRPGTMIKMTSQFMPALVKGIKVDPQNPLLFEFLIEPGQVPLNAQQKKDEYRKLIKYFLASLTTPEKDMWVNLSPYENNRIISRNFGTTEMGRDMLAQDYILKQLAASLVYPEDELGKKFWSKVYERVRLQTGAAEVPVSTFNKVWILPASATVFEKGNVAMVTESRLRVMMEEDYNALRKNDQKSDSSKADSSANSKHSLASQTVREIVIPAIEQEINEGANFAQLRQMYNAMVLASWFKQRLKMHLLSRVYVNKDKAQGVDLKNPQENEEIYQQYIKAYKKGVYNYIKEEEDPLSGQIIPRKYFSGGFDSSRLAMSIDGQGVLKTTSDPAMATAAASAALDRAMVSLEPGQVEDARAEVSEVSDTGDISFGSFAEAIEEELNRINREEGVSVEMITRALGDAQTRSVIFEETVLRLKEQNDLSDEAASQTALRVINKMQEIVDIVGILRQEFEANVSQEQFLRDMYEIAVKVAIGQQIEDFEPDVKPLPTAQVEAILNVIQRVREAYTAGEITDAYRQAEAELAAIKERVQEQQALRETQNVPEADISLRQDKAERLLLTLGQEVLKFQSQQNELRAKAELLVEQYGRLADLDIDQQATNKLKLDQEANALRAAFALNKGAYQKALSRRMAVLRIKGSQILPAVEERLFSDYMSTSSTIDNGSLRQQKLEAYLSFLKEVKPSFLKDLQETEKALGRSFDLLTYEDQLRIAETRAQERLGVLQDAYQQEQRAKEAAAKLIARIRQAPLALPAPGESQALQAQEERRLAQELKEANQRRDEARVKELFNALQTLKRQRQQEERMARASQAARQAPKRQTPLLALPAPGESQALQAPKVLSKKEKAIEVAREMLRTAQEREGVLFSVLQQAQQAEAGSLSETDLRSSEEATNLAIREYFQAQGDTLNAKLRLEEALKAEEIDEERFLSNLQEQARDLDREAEEAFSRFRQALTERGARDLDINILDLTARIADLRHDLMLKDIASRQEKDTKEQFLLRNDFRIFRQAFKESERIYKSVIVLADRLAQARETFDEAREKEEDKGYVDELERIFQATERQTLIEVEMALANIRFAGEEAQTQEQKEEEKPELEPIDDEAARNIFSLFGFAGEAQLSIAAEEESALAQIGSEPTQQVRTPVLSSPFAGKTNTRQIRSEIDRLSNQATTPELKERLKELLGQTIAYAESRQMKELASFARTKLTRMNGDLTGEQPRMTTPLIESDSELSLETSPAPQTGLIVPLTAPETAPQKDTEPASGIKRSSLSALTSFFLRAAVFLAVLTPSSQRVDTMKKDVSSDAAKPRTLVAPRSFAPVLNDPLKQVQIKLPALPLAPVPQMFSAMENPLTSKILLPRAMADQMPVKDKDGVLGDVRAPARSVPSYKGVEDIVIRAAREVVKKIGQEGAYIDKDKPGVMTTTSSRDRLNALISDPSFPSGEKSALAMRLKEFAGGKAAFTEQEISDMRAMVDAWHRDFPENNKPQASAELADGQEPVLPLRSGSPSSNDLLLLPPVGAVPDPVVADNKQDKKKEAVPVPAQKVTDIRSKHYTIKKGSILADRVYAPLDQVVVTSSFGVNRPGLEAKKATHPGTDLKAAIGTLVYSMFDGKVIMSAAEDDTGGYGNMVAVLSQEKDGRFIIHMYAHLNSKPTLKKGEFIKGGASIGESGETGKITGPHLHLEFRNLDPRVARNIIEGSQDFNLGMGRHYAGNLLNPQDYLAQLDAVKPGEFAELKLKGDDAMTTDPYGGIDFDAKYLDLNMKGEAIELSIPEGFQWLINTPIRGFTPQILDIRSGLGFQLSFFKGLLDEGQERTAKANAQGRMSLAAANHKFTMMCALARA